jgi:BT1 family
MAFDTLDESVTNHFVGTELQTLFRHDTQEGECERKPSASYQQTHSSRSVSPASFDSSTRLMNHNDVRRSGRIAAGEEAEHDQEQGPSPLRLDADEPPDGILPLSGTEKFSLKVSSWLYPPDLPKDLQLTRIENIAVPGCYLMVGLLQGLSRPLLNVYPIDLGATEAQQTIFTTIVQLPAATKLIFGFISDSCPLCGGYRRKPYMLGGWLLVSFSMAFLYASSDLRLPQDDESGPRNVALAAEGARRQIELPNVSAPSLLKLGASFLLLGVGMWFADVMADSMVAQKARSEPASAQGNLQASCYATRFFGQLVAAPLATILYSREQGDGPAVIIILLCFLPIVVMAPLWAALYEDRNYPHRSTREQCHEIWETVKSRSVWQPMSFAYIFTLLQVPNAAWKQYLKSSLHFTDSQLNSLVVVSYLMLYVGTVVYKQFFLQASWRRVFQVGMALNMFKSSLQLLLIRGYTFGLSPFVFALGDDAFADFLSGILFLPIAMMMVSLCPPGSEGASYAMYTTIYNSAWMLAPALGTLLLPVWDVSKEALQDGETGGLFKLSLLTAAIQTAPFLVLRLLPRNREELYQLGNRQSAVAAILFLIVVFGSIMYSFSIALFSIVAPGWFGAS